jgi:nucleotide-binding universal stress UspA family protein
MKSKPTTQRNDAMKTERSKEILPLRPVKASGIAGKQRLPPSLQLGKILVPVDFSDCSRKALDYALPFAVKFGATVTLLHAMHVNYYPTSSEYAVFDYPELIDELQQYGEKELGNLADSVRKVCPARTLMETGHPGEVIVATAKKLETDFIIISTHGRTGWKRAFLGSTAEYVVRHAPCPVLVVREREQEFVRHENQAN